MLTQGEWLPDVHSYESEPKKIIVGVKVEIQPNYFQRIFDTILPETDEEYIKEHNEIESNVRLVCAAKGLLSVCQQMIKAFNDAPVEWLQTQEVMDAEIKMRQAITEAVEP